jgi:hypothetical protein
MPGTTFQKNSLSGTGAVTGVGTTLSGGAAITALHTNGTTSAGQVSFVLPALGEGEEVTFICTTATSATVFPNTASGTINGGSAGAAVTCAQSKPVYFRSLGSDKWLAVIGA